MKKAEAKAKAKAKAKADREKSLDLVAGVKKLLREIEKK